MFAVHYHALSIANTRQITLFHVLISANLCDYILKQFGQRIYLLRQLHSHSLCPEHINVCV